MLNIFFRSMQHLGAILLPAGLMQPKGLNDLAR